MSVNYENLTCQHCGNQMHDGEDIVVCPVCATPQHRECWMQAGHCANDALHASGYVWQRENKKQSAENEHEVSAGSKVCHVCGSENPDDSMHCGNCGALFAGNENSDRFCSYCGAQIHKNAVMCVNCGAPTDSQKSVFNANPYLRKSEFREEDLIAGQKAGDIAIFVQASSHRYLRKFRRFADGKKLSFNFAAFFFAPYWFFYRKLYKAGAFFIVLFATVSLMLSGLSADVTLHTDEFINNYGTFDYENATEEELYAYEAEIEKGSAELSEKIMVPLAIIGAVNFGMSFIAALVADRLYYKKVFEDMKAISDAVREENMRRLMLARKGGLSAFGFALSIFGYNMFINLMVYAADFITQF